MTKKIGSIHGRFQPFHNGHLQYFNWAASRCDLVYIGITQIFNQHSGVFPGADHRGLIENNPLTYFERAKIIETALLNDNVASSQFRIIPFPIEEPFTLPNFLPPDVTCFTTIHSEWNEHKITILRDIGYDVVVLDEDESNVERASGEKIRTEIRSGSDDWENFVPLGTRIALRETNLLNQIKGK